MSIAVRPPPTTTTGSRTCMLAIESRLRGAGELQRHQEVRRGAHAAGEAVGHVEHRRLARARRERDVVEAQRERVVGVERAAEAHAAEQREAVAPLEQQADHLEEVLVPAHGDAVLGHAAEAGHQRGRRAARISVATSRTGANGTRSPAIATPDSARVERLDLQPVDADHRVAVVHQVVREREAGRPHADDQHALARCAAAAAGGAG